MKRKAIVATLSLVMCLLMAFPASASKPYSFNYPFSYILNQFDVLARERLPSDYKYRLVSVSLNSFDVNKDNFEIVYLNTPTLTVGSSYYIFWYVRKNFPTDEISSHPLYSSFFSSKYTVSSISLSSQKKDIIVNSVINGGGSSTFSVRGVFEGLSTLTINGYSTYKSQMLTAGYDASLVFIDDLLSLISQSKAKQNTGYTQTSWNAFQSQIIVADNLLKGTGYTQAQVDSAKNALQAALDDLQFLPDISFLQVLISQAKAKQNTGYTQSSWNALQSQISAAENLLATTGYTQAQIDSAKNALQSAFDGLVLLPTTPDLTALLSESNVIENNGYTSDTWTRLTNARNAAHALLLSADYNQIKLDSVYYELSAAINGLTLEVIKPPDPPKPPQKPLGYDLSTGDISGYLNVVPRIFYNYVLSAKDIGLLIFGIVLAILLIPRILSVIIPNLKR